VKEAKKKTTKTLKKNSIEKNIRRLKEKARTWEGGARGNQTWVGGMRKWVHY